MLSLFTEGGDLAEISQRYGVDGKWNAVQTDDMAFQQIQTEVRLAALEFFHMLVELMEDTQEFE